MSGQNLLVQLVVPLYRKEFLHSCQEESPSQPRADCWPVPSGVSCGMPPKAAKGRLATMGPLLDDLRLRRHRLPQTSRA